MDILLERATALLPELKALKEDLHRHPELSWREVRTRRLIFSTMCTGMRMVRAWSAMERVMACRIHQVA